MTVTLILNIAIASAAFLATMILVARAIRTAHHHDGMAPSARLTVVGDAATPDFDRRAA